MDQLENVDFSENFLTDLSLIIRKHGVDRLLEEGKWHTLSVSIMTQPGYQMYIDSLMLAKHKSSQF